MQEHLLPFAGIAMILAFMYVWSDDRKHIQWRLVGTFLAIIFIMAGSFLKIPGPSDAMFYIGVGFGKLGDWGMEGAKFVLDQILALGKFDGVTEHFIFGFRIPATIIFVCGLCEIAFFIGVLQLAVKGIGFLLRKLGLGGAEALSCAATPFLGQVESQLLIKQFMTKLTSSALFTCMTTSMAATAGSALVLYMILGLKPQWLITASLMNTMSGIMLSKMKRPETRRDLLEQSDVQPEPSTAAGFFDAMERGAMHGARIAGAVIIMVGFSIALMAMCNELIGHLLHAAGVQMTFEELLGWPFAPVAFMIGVPWEHCLEVGKLTAPGALFNEVVSMINFMDLVKHGVMPERVQLLVTCAITIFAHPGSIGIQIGGLSAMAPDRRAEIAANAPRAMVVATMSAWLTACVCSIVF